MKFHQGPAIQHGAGLGSIFSGLWRSLVPAAKSAVKTLGKIAKSPSGKFIGNQVKQAAVDTALDALEGKSAGASAKNRLKTATKNILHATQYTNDSRYKKRTALKRGNRKKVRQPAVKVKRRRIHQAQPLFDDYYEEDEDY